MKETNLPPKKLNTLTQKALEINFNMGTDFRVGKLLQTLIASKPNGNFLEIGTGMGLSTVWIREGMDKQSKLISIDNDPELMKQVTAVLENDTQIELITIDGNVWLENYKGSKFDLIFADAWPGKYSGLDNTLKLIKPGGFYVIDDMLPQPNWPEGHDLKVEQLLSDLKSKLNFQMTVMNWSTGVVILTKK